MELLKDNQGVVWTSPNGNTFYLKTLEDSYTQKHIGEVKENPKDKDSNKKKVQDCNDTFTDMGVGGKDVSLDCYFIGDNHTTKAKELIEALKQKGKSKLKLVDEDEFTVNVLSFSKKRTLVKNQNCTIVSIEFHETAKTSYPTSSTSKTKQLKNQAEDIKEEIAQTLTQTVENIKNDTSRVQSFSDNFSNALTKISDELSVLSNASLKSIMTDISSQNIISNISTITSQVGIVLSKAATLANNVKSELSLDSIIAFSGDNFGNWENLINDFISLSKANKSVLNKKEIDNLIINDAMASMSIISFGQSLAEKNFETRLEAVEAAKTLKELEEVWTEFIEDELQKAETLENAVIRNNNLNDFVNAAASSILERSYKLKIEQTIILEESASVIDLAYRYYPDDFEKDPDKTVNYLITTNNFVDDEFFYLEKGTEFKIYV